MRAQPTRASALIARLSSTGIRRGLREGSRGWLYVGMAASALRAVRWITAESEAVERVELKPGEGIEIRTVRAKR